MVSFKHGYAVVIGVGESLPVTVSDANALAGFLTDPERCAYPIDQVKVLTEQQAQRDRILAALDWITVQTNNDPESTALVYFSGHGGNIPDYYLIPFGFRKTDLETTGIKGSEFTQKLQQIKARKLLVFLDCCHAGGMADAQGEALIAKSPLAPDLLDILGSGRGRAVIASSRKDELSFAIRDQQNSIFTRALMEALAGYGAFENDGFARVLDVAMYLGRVVPERAGGKQNPIIKIHNLEENFPIAFYAAGDHQPKGVGWRVSSALSREKEDADHIAARQRMLRNYRTNLLLIEERMSEYINFTDIPLQLIRQKQVIEERIRDLNR